MISVKIMGNILPVIKSIHDKLSTNGENFDIDEFHELRKNLEDSLVALLPRREFTVARTSFAGADFGCGAWHVDGRAQIPDDLGVHRVHKNAFHLVSVYPAPLTEFYLEDLDQEWVEREIPYTDCDFVKELPFNNADPSKIGTIGKPGDVLAIDGRHIHRTPPSATGMRVCARISCAPLDGKPGIF